MAVNVRGGDGAMTVNRTAKSAGHVTGYGTLDGYPMERSHVDTMKTIANRRQAAKRQRELIGRATVTSDKLWRYSKMLFDEAVDGASRGGSANSGDSSLPSITPDRGHVPTYGYDVRPLRQKASSSYANRGVMTSSGPSHFGSPLYNHRPKLLNDIRLRPKTGTCPTSRDENGIRSDIKVILAESNEKYRVVPSTSGSVTSRQHTYSRVSGYPEYLLVPKEGATSGEVESMSADVSRTDDGDQREAPSTGNSSELSENGSDTGPMDLVTCSGEDPETDPGSRAKRDTELSPDGAPDAGTACDNQKQDDVNRPEAKAQNGANSSLTSSIRSVYRKVTWVDELTVSTPDGASKAERNATSDDAGADGNNDVSPTEEAKERKPEVRKVVNLNDLRANSWSLPDFVCPTSEEKSKKARMAAWLQTTNFTSGRKTVPLL